MQFFTYLIDFIIHLDTHLTELVERFGHVATYGVLFAVVFAETGLVITPFLPGDSLLFTAGAIASITPLDVWTLVILLTVAAILGDTANYWIGHYFGRKIVDNPKIPFINQEHIDKTQQFYKKHGGKTVVLARFLPIVRTFAPFVAGVGTMDYGQFIKYNVIGGVVWVWGFTFAGYYFGNLEFVRENFHYLIFAIIGLSIVPIIYEYINNKRHPDVPGVSAEKLKEVVNE